MIDINTIADDTTAGTAIQVQPQDQILKSS